MKSHRAYIVPNWQLFLFVTGFLAVLLPTNCQSEPEMMGETAVPPTAITITATSIPATEISPTPEPTTATEPNPELARTLQNIIDQAVADGAPGAVLMVDAPDMNFTWKGAAGLADPAAGLAMEPDDQFIISGGVELFTAVTLLKISEGSQLNLEDPISLYLPADLVSRLLVLDGNSLGGTITIHQLLNHTSGLGDFASEDVDGNGRSDFNDLILSEPDRVWTPDAVLQWAIENVPPVGKPGAMFHYSETNFLLLGRIIEKVSGLSLAEAYRQFIFEPLGMEHTYLEFYEDVAPGVNGRALSHAFYNGADWNRLSSRSYEWGSGGLVSTVEDQNRFLRAWANGKLFNNSACKGIMSNWIRAGDAGNYYGLGMQRFVMDEWDIPGLGQSVGHGGLFNSWAFYWPEQNVTMVGTLNRNEPQDGFVFLMLDVMAAIQEYGNQRFIVGDDRC